LSHVRPLLEYASCVWSPHSVSQIKKIESVQCRFTKREWSPARWSVCLPLLIFPCTIKSRSSLLAPAHPGGPRKKDHKTVVVLWLFLMYCE